MSNLVSIMSQSAEEMTSSLARIRAAFDHNLTKGEAAEETVRSFLRRYLPSSLGVTKGQVIDSNGQLPKQLDVIIYDTARTPIFFSSEEDGSRLVPSEGVFAVVEVKTHIKIDDVEPIIKNMLSVKNLDKSAYAPQDIIEQHFDLYGSSWDHFPTLYFVLSFECDNLISLGAAFREQMASLELSKRVDMACLLSQGVLVNQAPDEMISCVSSPGSTFSSYKTPNALLLFYILTSGHLLQAKMRPMAVHRYLPKNESL